MSLTPGDLITKLKFLFITVMALFGGMLLGSLIGYALDVHEKAYLMRVLMQPDCGFRRGPGGVWLWRLTQEPMTEDVGPPKGTIVRLSAVFGIPFARLRYALPEALLPGTMADALGRRCGVSCTAMYQSRSEHDVAMARIKAGIKRSFGMPVPPALKELPDWELGEGEADKEAAADAPDAALQKLEPEHTPRSLDEDDNETPLTGGDVVGSAMVFAFFNNCSLIPLPELAVRQKHTARALRDISPGTEHDFQKLLGFFMVLLNADNLTSRNDWLLRARMWRLILGQATDGSWGPSACVAAALYACEPEELARAQELPKRRNAFIGRIAEIIGAADDDDDDDLFQDDDGEFAEFELESEDELEKEQRKSVVLDPAKQKGIVPKAFRAWRKRAVAARTARLTARGFLRTPYQSADDVLAASAAPLVLSIPRALRLAAAAARRGDAPPPTTTTKASLSASFAAKLSSALGELRAEAAAHPPARNGAAGNGSAGAGASLREKLEQLNHTLALSQQAASGGAAAGGAAVLREQLQTLTHELRLQQGAGGAADSLRSLLDEAGSSEGDNGDAASCYAPSEPDEPVPELDVERVWVTLLVLSVLQRLSECCLFSEDSEVYERTIVDAAHAYLDLHKRQHPALAAALADGSVAKKAGNLTARWQAVLGHRVQELRSTEIITSHMTLSHMQRTSSEVARAFMTRHTTFSSFLAPALDGMHRWQLFMILMTLVMSQLLVSIWCAQQGGHCVRALASR